MLIVTSEFPPQPGGIGNHAYHLALYLSKENYKVQVISDQRSQTGVEEINFDKTVPFSVIRIKRTPLRFKMYLKRLAATFKCFKDAPHVIATGKFSLWNVAFISLFYNNKTLAIVHGTEVNFKPFLLRKSIDLALKKFDTIVAVSNYTKQLVSHLKKPVVVISNDIHFDKWKLRETTTIELKGQPVLTTVGRVCSRKGQLNVIKHLPELIKPYPELHYHCIGIPAEAEAFMSQAKKLQVEKYITFHGSLEHEVLKQMLNQTDIFVMLSAEDTSGDMEGFGIAILEANAMGIPAIGSKGCGIEDAIVNGDTGLLIAHDDGVAFVGAVQAILKDREGYGVRAKVWAAEHDWSKIVERYVEVMESI